GLLVRMTLDQWQGVMDTNLTSAFLVTREVVKEMLRQKTKEGSVINISSVVAKIGNRGQTNYGASKAGLIGLTYSCAQEYEGRIRFNALALGLVDTELVGDLDEKQREEIAKKSNMITKKEVAEQVLYLASNNSTNENGRLITMNGRIVSK
ncbi:MAG: SDR family oxidoreductase, partial [Candidatus Levybacteria bacterium]|nr:SDR family oxidoreductase [Candidatus Levybacteria bacterium]